MKEPKILDNKKNGRVVDELKNNIYAHSKLSVISAYFTIYAYESLKSELSKLDKLRFIFTEPTYANNEEERKLREYYIENKFNRVTGNEYEIKLRNEMNQSSIAKECANWVREKAEFKAFKKANPAQPRLVYIEGKETEAINGSVDFTSDGLGISPSNRFDYISCMYGKESTEMFIKMFNELWNNSEAVEEVTNSVLEDMETLYKENEPELIYYNTLYHIFYDYLDELTEDNMLKTKTGIKETKIWNLLYKFQKDGVMGIIDKIEKYNGCILADSVGLGKTYSALAVIKYYELRNDRVLVLCPKKLRENWTIYKMNDKRNTLVEDRFNFDVLNHTDLSRNGGYSGEINLSTINWENYDLLVIDESHGFRNNPPINNRTTRYERLMNDIIKAGIKTKVLMLTATPVNNRMNDIKNQIAFITEGDNTALNKVGIKNIEQTLRKSQLLYNKWLDLSEDNRTAEQFIQMIDMDYFKLLDTLTIARSRKHIEKYYNIEEIGEFPKRNKPINMYSGIDSKDEFLDISKINNIIKRLTLAVYSPMEYIKMDKRDSYAKKYDVSVKEGKGVFKQADREKSLVNLMRINILKRMESSVYSFTLTLEKILYKIENALSSFEAQNEYIDDDLSIEEVDFENELFEDLLIGNKVKVLIQDIDLIKWKQDLELDREKLNELLKYAKKITPDRDEKLLDIGKLIKNKIKNPINEGNKKVIIFTAFADTANYLYKQISPRLEEVGIYTALVTGGGDNKSTFKIPKDMKKEIKISDLNTVLTLFSPISKSCDVVFPKVKDRIDVLVATDCISEGQNLQDCDYLINYDIHWNPVRIVQRFGRIDRIGSKNDCVQLVNFWPTKDLDEYINLEQRVQGRMVLMDISATGEENIIEYNGNKEMKDLYYRKKQLEKLQAEVVDLEEISGGISITDLTFSDFKVDLMDYMKTNRKKLESLPSGLFAITNIENSFKTDLKPGVIFILKQVEGAKQTKEQNALFPHYLSYITQDGEVKLSFGQSKNIIDILKKCCKDKKEAQQELINIFNRETDEGNNMKEYSELLKITIENLIGKKEKAGAASLFSSGGTTMDTKFFDGLEDFELVSFLILKE